MSEIMEFEDDDHHQATADQLEADNEDPEVKNTKLEKNQVRNSLHFT